MAVLIKRSGELIDIFSQLKRGRVLDIPAGGGEESLHLLKLGYEVCTVDLFLRAVNNPELPSVQADANEIFPFRSEVFDYVLSREGIEHLENQAHFVRECGRILKASGKLILTTPNMMHLGSRLSHFLTGQRVMRRGLANEIQTLRGVIGSQFNHGHIFLIDYFRLRYLLRLAGFGSIDVFTDKYSPTSIALAWLVPIFLLASKLSIKMSARIARRKRQKGSPNAVLSEILSHVFSPALLFGKRMIVIAEKDHPFNDEIKNRPSP